MTHGYTIEAKYEVYDDATGDKISVGDDADGLEAVEIKSVDRTGCGMGTVMFPREMLPHVIKALEDFRDFCEKHPTSDNVA
jgi:hypothetical protein